MPADVYIGARLDNASAAIERIATHGDDVLTRLSTTLDLVIRRDAEQTAKLEAREAEQTAKLEALARRMAEIEAITASWSKPKR